MKIRNGEEKIINKNIKQKRAKNGASRYIFENWKMSPKSWNYYWYLHFVASCLSNFSSISKMYMKNHMLLP